MYRKSTKLHNNKQAVRGLVAALSVVAATVFAVPASAQMVRGQETPQQGVTQTPKSTARHFSAKTVTAAGHAMRDITNVNKKYLPKLQMARQANDQNEVQKITQKATGDALQKLASDGISPQKYQQVVSAARSNPLLRAQVLEAAGAVQKK
jgi:hypothetical protein